MGLLAKTLGSVQPFRYRGYVFDEETGLYYLRSRYYNPRWGRFVNADRGVLIEVSLQGCNEYIYGINNPINTYDSDGNCFIFVAALVGCVVGAVIGGCVAASNETDIVEGVLYGALIGGVVGGTVGAIASIVATGSLTASTTAVIGIKKTAETASIIATAGTVFGKLGTLVKDAPQIVVDWAKVSVHALERMAQRGITPEMIESWIQQGAALQQTANKFLFISQEGAAVVTTEGVLVTAYPAACFDASMMEVVKMLFGQ